MKKTGHLRTFSGLLVVFFLLTFITSRSLTSISIYGWAKENVSLKNSGSPVKQDTQCPYEETEKEGEDGPEDDNNNEKSNESGHYHFFISLIGEPLLLSAEGIRHYCICDRSCPRVAKADQPIYLSKKTLLI